MRTLEDLKEEHQNVNALVDRLQRERFLNVEDEQYIKLLKKRKLALKDQIEMRLHS